MIGNIKSLKIEIMVNEEVITPVYSEKHGKDFDDNKKTQANQAKQCRAKSYETVRSSTVFFFSIENSD